MGPSRHALSLSQFVPQRERAPTATCAPIKNRSHAHVLTRENAQLRSCRIATTVTAVPNHPATSDIATRPVDRLPLWQPDDNRHCSGGDREPAAHLSACA